MRHTVEASKLEGYTVEKDIVSTTGGRDGIPKSLSVVTTIFVVADRVETRFRVTDWHLELCRDHESFKAAILDYNEI